MSDLYDFLASTIARQVEAEEALHNGDPGPRLAMWSTRDPVTVSGWTAGAAGSKVLRGAIGARRGSGRQGG
jgi:hypothetical protein